jgi:hypothetical protein
MGGPRTSKTAGGSWTLGQYILAAVALNIGARVFGRIWSEGEFKQGGWDLIFFKLVWTEGIARSGWAKQQFGANINYDPASGTTWLTQGGQQVSMQGAESDRLVTASAMDGSDRLVTASPLDGLGHLLPPGTDDATAKVGRNSGSGYVSNYQAAYT